MVWASSSTLSTRAPCTVTSNFIVRKPHVMFTVSTACGRTTGGSISCSAFLLSPVVAFVDFCETFTPPASANIASSSAFVRSPDTWVVAWVSITSDPASSSSDDCSAPDSAAFVSFACLAFLTSLSCASLACLALVMSPVMRWRYRMVKHSMSNPSLL